MNTLPKIGAIFYILLACLLIIPHPVNSQSDPPRSGIWYASQSIAKESKLAFPPLPTESTFPNIKVNQDNSGRPQNETSIIFNETNFYNLVGGANDYRLTFASPGYYYSTDGGQTWDDGLLPLGGSYDAGGDPALACDANGNIYYAHISFDYGVGGSDFPDNGLFVNRSTDGGATWMSSPFIVAQNGDGTGTTYDQPYFEDKPYIACDALAQSSYQNTAYVSWTKYFQEGTPTQIYFSRLVPGQPGFSTGIQISDAGYAQGSIPAVGPGGIVYVIWFKITGSFQGTLQLDQSDDGGSTFGTDQTIVDGISRLYDVKGTIRANNYPAAAVDNSGSDYNGYVYVVWTDKRLGDPDIYFTRGIPQVNGQLQWDNPKRVNNDTPGNGKDQWFPWITVASDGTIYIVYYDSRADANNILTDVYVATSFDAGENFYQEKVNTQSFDPRIGFNGSFMGDYNGITALPEQAYPFWTDMRSGNDQDVYVALYDRPVVEVTVDQKLDTGTRVGTIGRWNGASFDPRFTPPQVLPLDLGTTEVFHGDTLIYSGQKYHRWNDDPDVTNHHVFDIDLNFPNFLTSNFEPTHNGVVIKNDLISAPNQDGGTIDFKDPWFIDYPDPAYGNNKRNRGMDEALYKPQSSPFNPNTNPTGSGSEYKGVFLNQGGSDPQNPIPPYYSVRILQTQTIPFHGQNITWYFQGWEGDAVDFEAAEATETAVIFRDANAEARAVYKGHLASSNPAATAHNNGRRVVRDGEGTLHAVYEDGGQIWYTYSTTNGKTWVAEARLNEINFPEDQNLYPAIAEFQGALHVVWTTLNYYDQELLGIYIRYRSKEAGGQWQDILDAAPAYPPPVQATPKPSIEVWYSGAAGGTAVICYNHPNQPEDIITRYWDSTHFVTSATVATGSDPSLAAMLTV